MVITAYGKCRPHQGRFDDDDTPLKPDGQPFRPGIRLCGKRDCIAKSHIKAYDRLEMERIDISYRTGIELTDQQKWQALEDQKPSAAELSRVLDPPE